MPASTGVVATRGMVLLREREGLPERDGSCGSNDSAAGTEWPLLTDGSRPGLDASRLPLQRAREGSRVRGGNDDGKSLPQTPQTAELLCNPQSGHKKLKSHHVPKYIHKSASIK